MALPFDLPSLSRGFAELSAPARTAGAEALAAAGRSVSSLLGADVSIRGRAVPGVASPRLPAARLAVQLAALPAQALLEVEPALVVRLVDVLAGGPGAAEGATALTPVEGAALELLALAALDGVCSVAAVEERLAPRLARGAAEAGGSALAIELDVAAGAVTGRARILLPASAVRALRGPEDVDADPRAAAVALPCSLRSGGARLLPDELEALAPGDVVVLEATDGDCEWLVLPGGARLRGRREDEGFHVEEMVMAERTSQVPVRLEVELARVEIPLGELSRLAPGVMLPLAIDRRGLVTLRAGERAVAYGELIELDGAVGVRILSVEGAS
jgi:type III secretion protein Q